MQLRPHQLEALDKMNTKRLGWKGTQVNGYLGKATTGGGTFACIAS